MAEILNMMTVRVFAEYGIETEVDMVDDVFNLYDVEEDDYEQRLYFCGRP